MDRPPSKPWRVYGPRSVSYDYRALRGAYDRVQALVSSGTTATVYHWEDGSWRLYERLSPAGGS